MQTIDTLIHGRWIVPVDPHDTVLEHHAIAVHDGKILELLPSEQAREKFQADSVHELGSHLLIPGLINAHTHAPMNLLRGIADDLPLMDWLQNHIWPAEAAHVSAEFVNDGVQLAMAEMLRGGTTCFNDMYFFPGESAKAASQAGMRACVNAIVIDFPSAWANSAEDYLRKGLEVQDQYRHDPLITTCFGPHAPYTVSDEPLQKIMMYADELDMQIHMHIHETAFEVEEAMRHTGKRPLARLHDMGLLSPRLLAVHMTQLNDMEIELLAETGSHVVHCPESNMKLASGFCPVNRLLTAGVNVALGTDGAASNNDLDMFGEMRSAALLAKVVSNDASAVSAGVTLAMATLNGAKALGLEQITGSLTPGKVADITAVNLENIETQPVYHPVSHLVYAAGREHVEHVWVQGKHLLKNRDLTTLDQKAILAKTRQWHDKIRNFE